MVSTSLFPVLSTIFASVANIRKARNGSGERFDSSPAPQSKHSLERKRPMKLPLVIAILLTLTGCFGAQRQAINDNANNRIHELDDQCREHMTDWCLVQYRLIENERERGVADVDYRQQQTAESIRRAGEGFNRQSAPSAPSTSVQCMSNTIGRTTYTNCN